MDTLSAMVALIAVGLTLLDPIPASAMRTPSAASPSG